MLATGKVSAITSKANIRKFHQVKKPERLPQLAGKGPAPGAVRPSMFNPDICCCIFSAEVEEDILPPVVVLR
jgi:hypothetical protein